MDASALAPLKERLRGVTNDIEQVIMFLNTKQYPFEISITDLADTTNIKEILALVILGECKNLGLATGLRYEFYCPNNKDERPFLTLPSIQYVREDPFGFCPFDERLHELGDCPFELYFIFNP